MALSKAEFSKLLSKTERQHSKFMSAKGDLEFFFSGFVDFEFSIDFMPGDGILLLDAENSRVAPVSSCFNMIKAQGMLTQDNMEEISI